jgi:hypothetical protein
LKGKEEEKEEKNEENVVDKMEVDGKEKEEVKGVGFKRKRNEDEWRETEGGEGGVGEFKKMYLRGSIERI